jgi:hypothetical protein
MHIRDGWYFEGREDGVVRIAKVSNSCTHEILLSKNDWESIKKEVQIAHPIGRGAKMKAAPIKPPATTIGKSTVKTVPAA